MIGTVLLVNVQMLIISSLQINEKLIILKKNLFQKKTKMLGDEILQGKYFKVIISSETASFPCVFLCKSLSFFLSRMLIKYIWSQLPSDFHYVM